MDDARLGCVVCSLKLRDVHNVPTHTRGSNEATISIVVEFVSVDISSFLLLSPPVDPGSSCAIECAIQVCGDDTSVVVDCAVECRTLSPWYPSICYKDIKTTIELMDDLINNSLDAFGISGVALVCSA